MATGVEGRWTLLPGARPIEDVEELAETVAWQLLLRWGVVFRDVYLKERLAVSGGRSSGPCAASRAGV